MAFLLALAAVLVTWIAVMAVGFCIEWASYVDSLPGSAAWITAAIVVGAAAVGLVLEISGRVRSALGR